MATAPDLVLDAANPDTLYFANGMVDLEVLSLERIWQPAKLGQYGSPYYSLVADHAGGDTVYVSYWNGSNDSWGRFAVVSVFNPSHPGKIGHIDFAGPVRDLHADGSLVYAAVDDGGSAGLRVVDVATPIAPRLHGELSLGPARAVRVDPLNGRAYLAGQTPLGAGHHRSGCAGGPCRDRSARRAGGGDTRDRGWHHRRGRRRGGSIYLRLLAGAADADADAHIDRNHHAHGNRHRDGHRHLHADAHNDRYANDYCDADGDRYTQPHGHAPAKLSAAGAKRGRFITLEKLQWRGIG